MASTGKSFEKSWGYHTVVSENDLRDIVFGGDQNKKNQILTENFCIEIDNGAFDLESLIEFAEENFPLYVMAESEAEDAQFEYKEALDRTNYRTITHQNGVYGELLMFLFVEGILDLPMVSHKVSYKYNPSDQVKGSDGLFYGEFQGSEALGIGEAKMYSDVDEGIDSALESLFRYHGPQADIFRRNEFRIASSTLDEDLPQEKVDHLVANLTGERKDHQLIHPVFIAYDSDEVTEKTTLQSSGKIRDEIKQILEDIDLTEEIYDTIGEEYPELGQYWLVFIFLPVISVDTLRKRLKNTIFPHSEMHS